MRRRSGSRASARATPRISRRSRAWRRPCSFATRTTAFRASASCGATSARRPGARERPSRHGSRRRPAPASGRPRPLAATHEHGGGPVAVEVELTIKAPPRLAAICRAWARCPLVDGVLYYAPPPVSRAVQRAIDAAQAGDRVVVLPLARALQHRVARSSRAGGALRPKRGLASPARESHTRKGDPHVDQSRCPHRQLDPRSREPGAALGHYGLSSARGLQPRASRRGGRLGGAPQLLRRQRVRPAGRERTGTCTRAARSPSTGGSSGANGRRPTSSGARPSTSSPRRSSSSAGPSPSSAPRATRRATSRSRRWRASGRRPRRSRRRTPTAGQVDEALIF